MSVDIGMEDTLFLTLVGQVLDQETRRPLPGALISAYNKCDRVLEEVSADPQGVFRLRLEPNCTYNLAGRLKGFLDDNEVVSTLGLVSSTELAAVLELTEIRENLVVELKNIYYDYGRYYIRQDAVDDLDNLVGLMNEYPSMKIEISSHTDSRGSDDFNKTLSQKRAETCVDYLVTKGIDADRLVARGYGEYLLKNDCANGVDCSEEAHQVNRRTEFKVLAFDNVIYSEDATQIDVNTFQKAFGADKVNRTKADMVALGLLPASVLDEFVGPPAFDEPLIDTLIRLAEETPSLLDRMSEATRAMIVEVTKEGEGESSLTEVGRKTATGAAERTATEPVAEGGDAAPALSDRLRRTNPPPEPDINPPDRTVRVVPADPPSRAPVNTSEPAATTAPAPVSVEPVPVETESVWWNSGVAYAVQIAFGTSDISRYNLYNDLGTLRVERKPGGENVVIIGYFKRFSEASDVQNIVRRRGIQDAFIVSYVDGQRAD
jgi:outer membrane protein OmpA-like peptidoglycan-associated protein